ncbi:hypothetical protein Bhyg_17977 [Pseudolycoriella hygida]|uniref:THAP-type domain-containing protein n=1 Tax=Pseudolycoriella hygida TaxID=35572 RepID=A0A9Q0MI24_9DIPT|nr:hypothetical protein Bhyg_17977 [Pseudolycoriella hygida]
MIKTAAYFVVISINFIYFALLSSYKNTFVFLCSPSQKTFQKQKTMVSCMVRGCKSRSPKMRMYRFPIVNKNGIELPTKRQQLWLAALRRKDLFTCMRGRVCEVHFVSGKCARQNDSNNVDWVPSLKLDAKDAELVLSDVDTNSASEIDDNGCTDEFYVKLQNEVFHVRFIKDSDG